MNVKCFFLITHLFSAVVGHALPTPPPLKLAASSLLLEDAISDPKNPIRLPGK